MRDWLTDDEADAVMANMPPEHRRWCSIGCGPRPGDDPALTYGIACACLGCLHRALSWAEFAAWREREASREPTPYVDAYQPVPEPIPLTLAERLTAYKASKRLDNNTESAQSK